MKKILVIDDQCDNITTIKAVIVTNLPNCRVLSAQSGKEGIEIAKNEQPDVIILDIIMPEMDGFEVCSKLKTNELTKHIPIILLTAIKTDSKSRVKGLSIGAEAFISKPIDASEFIAQVNVMLRIKEAEDILRAENKLLDQRVEEKSKKLIESYDKYHSLFINMINGFALHEIILDEKGKPVDYIFLEINDAFVLQTGFKKEGIIGKRVTEAMPGIENDPGDWIGRFGKVALGGGEIRFEQHSKQLDKWYSVLAYSTKKGTFTTVFNDITKQKKTEEQIRAEKRFIDAALNAQDDTFFLLEMATGKAVKWNNAFRKISGYSDEEIEKMPAPQSYYSEEDLERLPSFIQGLSKGESETIELDLICKGGKKIPTEYRISFLKDELQEPKYIISIGRDITERKKAELELHESQEKLELFFSQSLDGFFFMMLDEPIEWNEDTNKEKVMDYVFAHQRITKANDAILEQYGATREQYIGLTPNDLFKHNLKEGKKVWREFFDTGKLRVETDQKKMNGSGMLIEGDYTCMYDSKKRITGHFGIQRDITDRKIAEDALRDRTKRYELIMEGANDAIWDWDVQNHKVYFSPRWSALRGFNHAEVKGDEEEWSSNIYAEDLSRVMQAVQDHFEGKTDFFEEEYRISHKDGSIKWILDRGLAQHDEDGTVVRMAGSESDITDRKIAEDALHESEQKYKDLFEKSDDAVLILSDNQFIDCNMATVKMLRYNDKKELINTHPSVLSPEKQPDGRLSYEKAEEMINIALKKGSHRFEWDHKKSDGEVFPVEVLLTSITSSDGKKIIHTVWRDITDRKRAELIQKTLYNISNASIKSDNIENLINLIQKELSSIIDTTNFYVALYDPESDTISLPFMSDEKDKFTKFPAGKTLTYYVIKTQKSLLATKEKITELENLGEVEIIGTDSEIWLGVPLKVEGKVTGVLAVQSYTDEEAYNASDMELLEFVSEQISISIDRKKAEQDLKTALHKATESDRLKSTFLASMSHELRTPLNAIIGFSSLVERKTPIDNILKYTNTINSSGNHLLSIVEDLFDITLIESGETKLKKSNVKLNELLTDIYEITKAEQNNIKRDNLEFKLITDSKEKEILIDADPVKLKQILINLLKNALKFTHEGYIHFGYKIKKEKRKKYIEFFVEDTGIGIPIDKQKFVFDVFARLEDAHSGDYGGTGIGLSIARKLTELMGGTIWVESDPTNDGLFRGSTFYFTLPYDVDEPESKSGEDQKIKVAKGDQTKKTSESKVKTILVVEDDEYSFEFIKAVLGKSGTNILRAINGESAIKFCKENPDIHVVLMDINMPVMNGFEATKKIKEFRPNLPIIAQTAYAIAGDREKALAVGCDDYISKPIKSKELIEKIKKWQNS